MGLADPNLHAATTQAANIVQERYRIIAQALGHAIEATQVRRKPGAGDPQRRLGRQCAFRLGNCQAGESGKKRGGQAGLSEAAAAHQHAWSPLRVALKQMCRALGPAQVVSAWCQNLVRKVSSSVRPNGEWALPK